MRVSTSTAVKLCCLSLVLPLAAACGGKNDEKLAAPPDAVMPQSADFGQPISVPVGDGSMSLTVQPLRLETNSATKTDQEVLIADVGAAGEFGSPFIEPQQFHAFSPDGSELKRLEDPETFLANPLAHTDLSTPGVVSEGSVGFIVPTGLRVGRLDFVTPESTLSYTVVRQPVDPAATPTDTPSDSSDSSDSSTG